MPSGEPDLSTGTVVYALLLNKNAIGIYTSYEKAEEARKSHVSAGVPATSFFHIKPFKLDGPALIYQPY